MKKLSVILLVAVLTMASVFAEVNVDAKISGEVSATYTVNCNDGTFAYATPNSDVDITFGFTTQSNNVTGEGLRAEVETKLTWTTTSALKKFDLGTATYLDKYLDQIGFFRFTIPTFTVKYYDIWTLNLLKAASVGEFAVSPIDTDTYATYYTAYYKDVIAPYTNNGVTLTWNGFTFAAAADGGVKADADKLVYTGVQTPSFNLGNGFTLQGAGTLSYKGAKDSATADEWLIAGSVKAGFTNADGKMTFTAATDQGLTVDTFNDDIKYDVDALLTAKVYPATVNVFYAKNAKSYYSTTVVNSTVLENLFSAKAVFDLNCWNAPIVASFTGLNLLNEAKVLSTEFQYTIADKFVLNAYGLDLLSDADKAYTGADAAYYDEFAEYQKVGAGATMPFGPVTVDVDVYSRIAKKTIGASAAATYTNKWFTAYAEVVGECKVFEDYSEETALKNNGLLNINASVEADNTVIKNAIVALEYAGGNLLPNTYTFEGDEYAHVGGTVTASITVEF